jgi:nucleoside-diphosphate-sugar epimerase
MRTLIMGDEVTSQTGRVELIAGVTGRAVTLRYFDPALLASLDKPASVFGQNLLYECPAVHTAHKLRRDLGVRPRYTLPSELAQQTRAWDRTTGLCGQAIDFAVEDQRLATIGA